MIIETPERGGESMARRRGATISAAEAKAKAAAELTPSSAAAGVMDAVERAEAGQLVDKLGRKMHASQVANLRPARPLSERPAEEAREIRQQGQKASVESQARRRTIRDIYSDLLQMPGLLEDGTPADIAQAVQESAQKRGKSVTVYDSIAVAMAAKARAGDVKAAAFVRDSVGDKPVDQMQVSDTITDGDRKLLAKLSADISDQDAD